MYKYGQYVERKWKMAEGHQDPRRVALLIHHGNSDQISAELLDILNSDQGRIETAERSLKEAKATVAHAEEVLNGLLNGERRLFENFEICFTTINEGLDFEGRVQFFANVFVCTSIKYKKRMRAAILKSADTWWAQKLGESITLWLAEAGRIDEAKAWISANS